MEIKSKRIYLYQLIPLILFILLWELIIGQDSRLVYFFGLPSRIASYLFYKTIDLSLLIDFSTTLIEVVAGFLIGNIVGTSLGVTLWYSRTVFLVAKPYIIVLGSAPIFALSPILVIWFGTDIYFKIMIAALSTVFIALSHAYTGASEVSESHLRLMQTFGASKHQIFRKVVAPSAIIWVMSAFRLNAGFAILGAFIGEYISSNEGLGHLILVASGLTNMSLVLCGVILLACIALLLNFIISELEPYLKSFIVKYF